MRDPVRVADAAVQTGALSPSARDIWLRVYESAPDQAMQMLADRGFDEQRALEEDEAAYVRHAVRDLGIDASEIL